MKKLMMMAVVAAATACAAEYATMGVTDTATAIPRTAKVVALDVVSTADAATVTVKTVRVVSSYTNCVSIAVVTNGIGEVSTVTNRWKGLKATVTRTNAVCGVTTENGVGTAAVGTFVYGGDLIFAEGVTNLGETVKAKLVIEK